MRVTKSEKIVYVDVDATLIIEVSENDPYSLKLDYYNQIWYIRKLEKNIEFVKSLKARGYHVIVHSANGWLHAKKVIELLQLIDFVDEVKSKPIKYIDDIEVQEWFGPRIYFR